MLRCQFLCHVLKALFFMEIALKLSYSCKKMQKFSSAGGSAPDPKINSPLRISGNASESSHNSLQYSVKSQHFLRVFYSFSLRLKQHKAVFKYSSDSQANFVRSTKLTAMYDSENALSHRNPTYYSIGIPVVSKLKLPPQQHKLK